MNYMTLSKTLYKSATFTIMVLTVAALSVPSAKVLAAYPTNTGDYDTTSVGGRPASEGRFANGRTTTTNTNTNTNTGSNNGGVVIIDSKAIVSTEPAIEIKKTSAVIQGAAHVDSGTATVWFEWGTRVDALDNTTRTVVVDPSGTGSSEQLTNLKAGTKYYYRIVARNHAGTCFGIIRSFTTTGGTTTVVKKANASSGSETTVSSTSNDSGNIKGSLSAAAANAESSNGFMPSSILGWFLIIVLIFFIAVVVRKIQRENEARKKRDEEAKKAKIA